MATNKWWLVYDETVRGAPSPNTRHESLEKAIAAAILRHKVHPATHYLILEVVGDIGEISEPRIGFREILA